MNKKPTYNDLEQRITVLEESAVEANRLQKALQESEEKFRVLAESTPTAVMLFQDGRYIYVNRAAETISGYSAEELIGMNFWEFIHPDYKALIQERGQKRQQGKETTNRYELKIISKDGTEKWVDLAGASTMIGGRPAGIISVVDITGRRRAERTLKHHEDRLVFDGIILDITDRKKAEEALKEGEEKYRRITENMSDIVTDLDPQGIIKYTSPSYRKTFGEKPEDLIGRSAFDGVHPEDRERVTATYLDSIQTKTDSEAEFRWRHADGHYVWLRSSGRTIYDATGEPQGQIICSSVITERKILEFQREAALEALRESEEPYRLLFEEAIEGIFRTTLDGRAIMINSALARMLGYASRQDAVEKITDIGSQVYADPEERKILIDRLMQEGQVTGSEVLFKRLDGSTLKVMLNCRLVNDKSTAPVLIEGSYIDINDKWLVEDALKASEEKYREIFEGATEGIYQTTPEGRYLSMNPAFARMFGFDSPQEMIDFATNIGQQLYVNPKDREEMVRRLREQDRVAGYKERAWDWRPFTAL